MASLFKDQIPVWAQKKSVNVVRSKETDETGIFRVKIEQSSDFWW